METIWRTLSKPQKRQGADFHPLWLFIDTPSIMERLRHRQSDQAIIDRTIGLVLGLFTALYRYFLKRCTLNYKVDRTIWRTLSKPPQRRHGPNPRPLCLLDGTPSAFGPELVYRLGVAQPILTDVSIYFDNFFLKILPYMFIYYIFYDFSALVGSIRRIIYNFWMCVLLWLVGRLGTRKPV